MIKASVAFLKGRLLSSQSEQFKKYRYSKSSNWLGKSRPPKKPLLFWSSKQANNLNWKTVKMLYYSLVKSKIIYYITTWCHGHKTILQNMQIKCVTKSLK